MAQTTVRAPLPAPPLRLQVLVAIVVAIAAGVFAASLRDGFETDSKRVMAALLLMALVGVAHSFPLHIAPKVQISTDTAPAFAAALLLPVPVAMLVSIAGIGFGELWRRTPPIQLAYNTSVAALRA